MAEEFIRAVVDSSLALALALIVIYWNRKDRREQQGREDKIAVSKENRLVELLERYRDDNSILIGVIRDFTEVAAELSTLIKRMNNKAADEK